MKKSEFKQIIKPIVSECIKESLMEGGLISGIIAEVVKGIAATAPIVENTAPPADPAIDRLKRNAFNNEQTATLKEHKSKLMAAIGGNAYNGVNLFEGTSAAPSQQSPTQQASPLAGQAPADPGVDISNLFGTVGRSWNAHMDNVKGGK
tara:strand:+ start:64 stop:510 length:447 start_codon:yes stop_codon:yes gene_type:complete